jgi:N-methylhydantoinase A
VVRIRVTASVKQPVGSIGALSIPQIEKHSRLAFFDGRAITTPIIGRSDLELPRDGPLLVDEVDTTTVVPPGWTAVCDGGANIVLERAS